MVEFMTQFVNAFMHFYLVFFFFSIFWTKKYRPVVTVLTFAILSLLLSAALIGFKNGALRFISVFGLTFLFSFLFKSKIFTKLIYVSIIYAINSIIELLVVIVMQTAFAAEFNFTNYNSTFIIGMLVSKFVTIVLLILLKFKKHDKLLGYFNTKYWNLLLFPIASLLCSILIAKIFIEAPNQSNFIQFLTLITFSALVVANMMIFDYIDSIGQNIKTKHTIESANEIIAYQTTQYQELINHNKEILKIKHDHKNFCIGIINALREDDLDDAMQKINLEYELCLDDHLFHDSIVHTVVDIKKKAIADKNMRIESDLDLLQNMNVSSVDIAIILGNALDNAIEACEKNKNDKINIINVDIKNQKTHIFIVIKNPVDENVDTTKLETNKFNNPNHHGFGIISMKQIAEKYNGEVLFSCEDNVFTTVIVLNNGKA